jgi:hypothetical protein
VTNHWILALAIGTSRGALAIGRQTEDGAVELHEADVCRIGSGVCPTPAERRLATAAALIRQSSFLERNPGLRVQVRLARPRPEILLGNLVRNLLGPTLEGLTQIELGVRCALNLIRVYGQASHPIGLIDFGCHYTEFAAQLASSKTFHAIIRIGSVHFALGRASDVLCPLLQSALEKVS